MNNDVFVDILFGEWVCFEILIKLLLLALTMNHCGEKGRF